MFRIALVLFKHVLGRPEQIAQCPTMYETMEKLRMIPTAYMEEEFLVQEVSLQLSSILAFIMHTCS